MIQSLSNSVIVPIAGMIITFVLCYELISMLTEKNNMHEVDTWMFFKYLCMKIMAVWITVILFGRMIEIYLYTSVAPIPFATLSNREWGQVGNNYFRGLLALAFQGFFMMVCVGIYAVMVSTIRISDNMHSALFGVMAYTVMLCFSLMKTGNLSKAIFNAH